MVSISYSDNERCLLEYLSEHGGITIEGYMKLAHVSRIVAENSAVNLCKMGVLDVTYHDGTCLLVLA